MLQGLEQRLEHGRDATQKRDLLAVDDFPGFVWIEARHQVDGATHVERREREDQQPEGVEEGEGHERSIASPQRQEPLGVETVEERLSMRKQRALGDAGGSRRVEQKHWVFGGDGFKISEWPSRG